MKPPKTEHFESDQSESRRLILYYANEADERLLLIVESWHGLTDSARLALEQELRMRDLWIRAQERMKPPGSRDPLDTQVLVLVRHCRTQLLAEDLTALLGTFGIEATCISQPVGFDLMVNSSEASRASELLATHDLHESSLPSPTLEELEYTSPICPLCQSSQEVVLLAAGETNSWTCNACGEAWQEDLTEHTSRSEGRGPASKGVTALDESMSSEKELYRKTRRDNVLFLILIACGTSWAFLASWYEPWTGRRILGLTLFLFGESLVYAARLQLGSSFSTRARAHRLITTGLYAKLQNPIYFFAIVAVIGLVLFLNQPRYGLILLAVIPIQVLRIRNERRVLSEKFGDEYLQYRKATWF